MRYQGAGDTADVQDSTRGHVVPGLQQPRRARRRTRHLSLGTRGARSTATRSGTSTREPLRLGLWP